MGRQRGALAFSAFDALPEVIDRLKAGEVPKEWDDNEDRMNLCTATPRGQDLIGRGMDIMRQRVPLGEVGEKQCKALHGDKRCYLVDKRHNFPLSYYLTAAGYRLWKASVHTRSAEECSAEGISHKPFRWAVLAWVKVDENGEVQIICAQLKLRGKSLEDFILSDDAAFRPIERASPE